MENTYVEVSLSGKIQVLLAQARSEKWNVGIAYALYSKYRQQVLQIAASPAERDRACRELRSIFGL